MSKNESIIPEEKTPDERIKTRKTEIDQNMMEEITAAARKETGKISRNCDPDMFNLNQLGIDLNDCSVRYASQFHSAPIFNELAKAIPKAPFSSKTIYDDRLALGWNLVHLIALMNAMIEAARMRENN